ncbi:hypothetical protein WS50_27925, partial [Burkholderia territorii]
GYAAFVVPPPAIIIVDEPDKIIVAAQLTSRYCFSIECRTPKPHVCEHGSLLHTARPVTSGGEHGFR